MDKRTDSQWDALLESALKDDSDISPDPIVNARLKARLYQIEEVKESRKNSTRKISLWYLPALLSILGSLVLSFAAVALMDGIPRYLALALAVNTSLGSAALTAAGVYGASWKEKLTLTLSRREKHPKGGISS